MKSPINLSLAGVAAAGAIALHSWPLAALGGAAYAALVALDLASPEFWRRALATRASAHAVTTDASGALDTSAIADAGLRQTAEAVLAARRELDRLLGEASSDLAVELAGLKVPIDELEERALRLIRGGERLIRYLGGSDASALGREIERLEARVSRTTDPEARAQYDHTVKARREQLAVLTELSAALERVHANLARIVATLEGLSAKIVRMGALDAQAMDNLSGDMNAELERMNREVDTFEETLRHVVAAEATHA